MSASSRTAATDPTLGNVFGTPVLFFPVPTPWPSSAGCDKYVYRQANEGLVLAWDPAYPSLFGTEAQSCFPSQQSSWWFQSTDASPSTALGPTFVCPEAYSAVHSTVLDSDLAAQTQYTYCCPPKFTLNAIFPHSQRSVAQCTSTAGPGVTVSFRSVVYLASTVTVTGEDGRVTRQTNAQGTSLPTSIVVQSPAITVYADPVNGFNIVERQASSASTSSRSSITSTYSQTPPSETSAVSTPPSGISAGAIAGAVVGAVAGLGLLALGAFFLFRRKRQHSTVDPSELAAGEEGARKWYSLSPQAGAALEMSASHEAHELQHGDHAYELPHGDHAHELPGHH